jgi:lipoprotein-anchoring transpeptidase ErfK/SrfK
MDPAFFQSREAVVQARDALRRGDMTRAREWAERAAQLSPQSEEPWLILAAVASPGESVDYIRKALQINPNSPRARKGMEWAMQRLNRPPEGSRSPGNVTQPTVRAERSQRGGRKKSRMWTLVIAGMLVMTGCAVFGVAAWFAVNSPVLSSLINLATVPQISSPRAQPYAAADIVKPTYTAVPALQGQPIALAPSLTPTRIPRPTSTLTDVPATDVLTAEEPLPTSVPEITATPGVMYAEIVPDTPTSEYVPPTADAPYVPPEMVDNGGVHWIDVDLSAQRVYAYAGDTIVNSFVVSTGTWQTPTVTGKYKVWIKLRYTDMAGPGYYLPDVPYVMYFYKGYGLHGTYWHNNFGTPMSHGCVNLTIPDAEWLYNFAAVGTVVNVHY